MEKNQSTDDKENVGSNNYNSKLSWNASEDKSLGIYTRNLGIEGAIPTKVLEEKDLNKSKSEMKDKIDLSKDLWDSLGSSFFIKGEENDKVITGDDDDDDEFEEAKKCLDHVNLTQSLMSQWIEFFRTYEDKAMKENLRKLYADIISKRDFWKNYVKKYPQSYFSVYYLINLVHCQCYLFKDALPRLEKMESFYDENETTTDLGPTDIAFLYTELANCYSNLEAYEKADIYFLKANQLIEKKIIVKPHVIAYYFSALGQHFLRFGNLDEALKSFSQCLNVIENFPDDDAIRPAKNILLAWCYIDFSDAYITKGNNSYRDAEKFLELAKERLKLSNNEEVHFMGKIERNYGQLSYKMGNKLKALHHYKRALEILEKTLPEKSSLITKYADERREIVGN